ncbi:MAG TPA: YceD family protein [Rudaea sp.]|nr:YceD family protein [Rudaea sp.]
MNNVLPESVDAWRMVQARRSFQGSLPLASLPRLRGSLAATDGAVDFDLEFGKDDLGVAHLRVRADASLPLTCQRTLEVFRLPVHVDARLGLIAQEADEAALPGGYEPLLTTDGAVHLADVVEDELILALPVVPVKPGAEHREPAFVGPARDDAKEPENPFAVLQNLKHK